MSLVSYHCSTSRSVSNHPNVAGRTGFEPVRWTSTLHCFHQAERSASALFRHLPDRKSSEPPSGSRTYCRANPFGRWDNAGPPGMVIRFWGSLGRQKSEPPGSAYHRPTCRHVGIGQIYCLLRSLEHLGPIFILFSSGSKARDSV